MSVRLLRDNNLDTGEGLSINKMKAFFAFFCFIVKAYPCIAKYLFK